MKPTYRHIPVQSSTFKAGLSAKVHRWFRLTPSYGPDLVREMLSELRAEPSELIMDPFSGASTTSIECAFEGFDSIGVEINPFLSWVGKVSTNWSLDVHSLRRDLEGIINQYEEEAPRILFADLESESLEIPKIYNPLRWWRSDVLANILVLKRAIANNSLIDVNRDFFRLALAGVLVPSLTNVTLGRLQLHFIDRSGDKIDVIQAFHDHVQCMISDLVNIQQLKGIGSAKVLHGDSLMLNFHGIDRPIGCVITSPPYPNRYSYVWNTRPHLYMLDFFLTPKEASTLDKSTIGGTWGTATSILAKGEIKADYDFLEEAISPLIGRIRDKDNLMANYVMKYFNMLSRQIDSLRSVPHSRLRCAYVVGNSRVKDEYVETDSILGEIFQGLGFQVGKIERIRKRHSGKDLHESIVYAYKS